MNTNPSFTPELDLSDPKVLAAQCKQQAEGMRHQAISAQSGTALGGHPYPSFFYNLVADTLIACAKKLEGMNGKPETPVEPAPAPTPTKAAEPVPAAKSTKVDKNNL